MPELWTLAGVNNWTGNAYDDYVGRALRARLRRTPDRSYASRLGTSDHYTGRNNVLAVDSEQRLDEEGVRIARDGLAGVPGVGRGELRNQRIAVMLIAPKTTHETPRVDKADDLRVEVYWSPYDHVPNQGIFRPDSLGYWRQRGTVWPIKASHALGDFFDNDYRTVKRVRRRRRGGSARGGRIRHYYTWVKTNDVAPGVVATVRDWLATDSLDLVIVAHSQGTNIAMHLLERGLR